MPLSTGHRLGSFEILSPLGAGAMGEVYKARDKRLGRDVAIKVLNPEAIHSPDRRRRFETEARAASALNHPNILTLHDIGEENGSPYIVSELLEGQPLRDALKNGALPLRTVLDFAVQLAAGLAAAHAAGITHRDLKPENLFVLKDGRLKILDFGLAKALAAPSETDETITLVDSLTSPGMILGTIPYMSPEQAMGQPIDFRSDQFSLGTILYEMIAGQRPFRAADRVSLLAAIVKEDQPPLAPGIPPPLRWIVERCLAKDPAARYASTADLHQDLRCLRDHLPELTANPLAPPPALAGSRRWFVPVLLAAALAVGSALALMLVPVSSPTPYRYTPLATDANDEQQPAWSPDGQTLAYIAKIDGIGQVLTRSLNSSQPARLTHGSESSSDPFWAPDGTRIYYHTPSALWSVGATGGAPQVVLRENLRFAYRTKPADISRDGTTLAYFKPEKGGYSLHFAPAAGGNSRAYQGVPFPTNFRFADGVRFSPNGQNLAVTFVRAIDPDTVEELWVLPYPTGTPRRVPWDIPQGVRRVYVNWSPDNRHCVFAAEFAGGGGNHLYQVDTQTGRIQPFAAGIGEESDPAVSPDGRRMAFASGGNAYDLTEISIDGSTITPLLTTSRHESDASWSASGSQYAYVSNASGVLGIWLRSVSENWARPIVEGTREERVLTPRFSPDGQRLAYESLRGRHAILITNLSGGRTVPLEQESTDQHSPAWSPDGNWVAYSRYRNQNWEITKAPSGGGGQPIRLAEGGGDTSCRVKWSPSGEWIGWQRPDGAVQLVHSQSGETRTLCGSVAAYEFSQDGKSAYVIRRTPDRHWELARLSCPDGALQTAERLSLSPETEIPTMRLHPDGKRFVVSLLTLKRDIWLLDGFEPSGWFARWWPR